jgi:endonuclease-8
VPEGHKIHRLAQDHKRDFAGRRLRVSSPQGRFADGAAVLDGRKLGDVWAWGKHLFYQFPAKRTLHVHLGRYGRVRNWPVPAPEVRGQVRLRVLSRQGGFDLSGPAACELLDPGQVQLILDRLGPDPLRPDADREVAWERIRRSKSAVGKLLLDQSVIAGVGNIYRADVLFALGIHPERPAGSFDRHEFDQLWKWLVRMMKIGVRYNRIITVDPRQVGKPRSRIVGDERFLIYGRKRCSSCGDKVALWDLGGRKMYACPSCQRW